MNALLALRLFLSFAAGYFLSYLLRNANAVIAPALSAELGLSAAAMGLMTAAYLLAFGVFQLPLGVLLDRFGPRRVESVLLLIAAAGCALFALATSAPTLTAARALIGLGVSSCLMASFKAFTLHFPPARQASLNAAVMSFGALGALAATSPLAALVPLTGWRGLFAVLAGLTLLVAGAVWATPDPVTAIKPHSESWRVQWQALSQILRHRAFWRYAPPAAASIGGFMAVQGLWAMAWLTEVAGLTPQAAADYLLLSTLAMLLGFIALALGVGPLEKRGWPAHRLLTSGLSLGLIALLAVQLDFGAAGGWFALGLAFTLSNLAYALLGRHFAPALAGRVATALNLAVFIGAAGLQWGLGLLVDALHGQGMGQAATLRVAFALLWLLQLAGGLWFVLADRWGNES